MSGITLQSKLYKKASRILLAGAALGYSAILIYLFQTNDTLAKTLFITSGLVTLAIVFLVNKNYKEEPVNGADLHII